MPFFKHIKKAAAAGLALFGLGGPPRVGDALAVHGTWFLRVVDADGHVTAEEVIRDDRAWDLLHNAATIQGLNYLLDAGFRNQTVVTQWYATLISNSGFTGTSTADTAASHSGWTEVTTYNEATRVAWSPPAASGGVLANSTVMTFTNSSGSSIAVRGLALFSTSTKGDTSGKLWNTATDGTTRTVANGSTLQVIYQLAISPGS